MAGAAWRIRRVASIPSIPGIRTSMKTTSGVELAGALDRFLTARRLADDDDDIVGELERGAESFPGDRVVVHDQCADRTRHGG